MCTNLFGYRPSYLRLPIVIMDLIPALRGPRLTSGESPCSVIPEINAHRTQILNKESYIQVPIITTRDRRVKFTRQGLRPNHTSTLIAENKGAKRVPMPSSLHRQAFCLGSVLVRRGGSEHILISKLRSFHVWSIT